MNYLTPADVQERLQCGRRQACRLMRLAGALELGETLKTATLGGAPVHGRHTSEAWSLAYAYRDVLSRRAVA